MEELDLIVSDAASPLTAILGETLDISWTVQNLDEGSVLSNDWNDAIYVSDDQVLDESDTYVTDYSATDNPPLTAGGSYTTNQQITIPIATRSGDRYLIFATDAFNNQSESNENNNILARAITLTAPDLVVSAATAPASVGVGDTVPISWTVTNQGNVTAFGNWFDLLYLSEDTVLDQSDIYFYLRSAEENPPLAAGASYTVNEDITIPDYIDSDVGYLLIATDNYYNDDFYNRQGETDETNNVRAVPIALIAPDLVVSTVTALTSAILGASVPVSWTVTNQSTVEATRDWYDGVYISSDEIFNNSDTFVTNEYISEQTPLAADGSYTITSDIILPPTAVGNRYLLIVADQYKQQGETDGTNNIRAVPITLSAPDLVVSAATAPTSAALGASIPVSWTVTNQGNVEAPGDWSDYVYISTDPTLDSSDTFVTSESISTQTPIAANGSYSINRNITLPSTTVGDRYLLIAADGFNSQGETEETNNVRAVPITLGAPDLVVSAATAPTSATLGASIPVSWAVTNQSNVEAPTDWSDYVYISTDQTLDGSDTFVTSEFISTQTPVAANGSYSINRNITLPSTAIGDRYLLIAVDGSGLQGETEETNNVRAVPITLGAPPILGTLSAANGTITGTLSNTDANNPTRQGRFSDDYTLTDFIVGERVNLSLSAGFDAYVQLIDANTQQLIAQDDDSGPGFDSLLTFIPQADVNYIVRATSFSSGVTGNYTLGATSIFPDLVVSAATAPTSATLGERLAVSWTVTNQGSGTALADWSDYVYISDNETLDGTDTFVTSEFISTQTPLAAGSDYTISRNITLPSTATGNRYLLIAADGSLSQPETNETDNVRALPITLGAPDLVVSAATAPASATLGNSVEVSWTVTNQGTQTAPTDWFDYIYISSDETFDFSDTFVTEEFISTQTPLAAGGSYTITRNITLPDSATGNRYLLFLTDGSRNQGETDENNNIRAVPIALNAPDLAVSNITAPVEALSGQPIEIAWTISNPGSVDATGNWTDYVYLSNDATVGNDNYIAAFPFTGTIAAGASIERNQSITVPLELSGDYRVVVTTDVFNEIPEGTNNQQNNIAIDDRAIQVRLSPIPNLQVTNVTAPPTAFSSQETVIQWTVTNTGNGATSAPLWNDAVYLSLDTTDDTDVFLGTATNPSYLNAGESYANSLTIQLPQGIDNNYYFLVRTDFNNQVNEVQNEGDNLGFGGPTDVQLTPPPDFQVTGVNAPAQAFSGQPLTLNWTVTNSGSGRNLETSWYDEIFMSSDEMLDASDRFLGRSFQNATLNSGESYNATQTVNLPIGVSGDFFFFVRTDAGNQVYENAFEGNNTGYDTTATRINLTPPPDLEVEFVNAPAEASASRPLTINYRVTNFGATATPNFSWTDTFYLSSDTQLDPNTDLRLGNQLHFGALDVGASYDNSATFTLPNNISGTYYAFVATDSANDVFELNNDNNVVFDTGFLNIASRPADLIISATAPSTAEAGKAIVVDWTVTNQGVGDTAVTSWTDSIVASTDAVLGNADDVQLAEFEHNGLLNPAASYSREELVSVPFNLVGQYNLFVVADADNEVYEATNEGNNSVLLPLNISRQTPELQVTQVSTSSTAVSGQPFTVNWTVQNLGAGRTNTDYWYDDVYLSADTSISNNDTFLGRVYHSGALEPSTQYNGSRTFNLPISTTGEFYTIVRTDSTDRVLETPLDNNNDLATTSRTTITQGPVPDLVVASVDAPITAISGQALNVTWTVRNDGAAGTGNQSSWLDTFYLSRDQFFDRNSDTYLGFKARNGNLGAGESYTDTASFTIPQGLSGPFYVFTVTDSGNRIDEVNAEQNNVGYDGNSTQVNLSQPADLVVGTIAIPANGVPGQNATISYTVTNQGANPALGSWSDSLYISADNQWDVGDAFFGQVQHIGDVSSGGSYSETLTAPLPGVLPGDYYVIIRSDIRNQIPETNENNNLKASLDRFNADAERLELGTPDTGTLGQGQSIFYKVDVPAGETLVVTLDSDSTTAFNELYVSFEDIPTRSDFEFTAIQPFNADQRVVIPTTTDGTYYISAFGNNVTQGSPAFDITAELVEFSVFDTSYGRGGNAGNLTIEINGAKFDRSVTASLIDGSGVERSASSIFYEDQTKAFATFNLAGLAPGDYDVVVENAGGDSITVNDGLEVVQGGGGNIVPQVDAPNAVGRNRSFPFTVTWANDGLNDAIVPLLLVENTVPFGFRPGDTSAGSSYTFLGLNSDDGPVGILRPGQSETATFFSFSDNQPGNYTASVDRIYEDLNAPFDWDALRPQLKPLGLSDTEFQPIFDQLIAQVGTTNGDYLRMLSRNAALLPEELGSASNVGALLDLEVRKAQAAIGTSISGTIRANDLNVDISGRTIDATNTDTSETFSTITLNDGSFIFESLPTGTYTFNVNSAIIESSPATTQVTQGEAVSGLSVEIDNGATIRGEVKNAATNTPISEALVVVFEGDQVITAAQSDSNGRFSIEGLNSGNYTLETFAAGFSTSWISNATIIDDEIQTVDILIADDASLTTESLRASNNFLNNSLSTQDSISPSLFEATEIRALDLIDPISDIKRAVRSRIDRVSEVLLDRAVELALEGITDITEPIVNAAIDSAFNFYLDAVEAATSVALIGGARLIGAFDGGGVEAAALYREYLTSTGPNSQKSLSENSAITRSFKRNSTTQKNIDKVQTDIKNAIEKMYDGMTLPCDHEEISQTFEINSLDFPSKYLLFSQGNTPTDTPDWNYNFKTSAIGVVAGSNGAWGTSGSAYSYEIPDARSIEGVANLIIPAGSSEAEVTFDLTVRIEDAVDFVPGDTAGFLLDNAIINPGLLERNGRAFDVPFTSTFKADARTLNFSVNLEDDDCEDDPDDEDDIGRPTSSDPNDITGPEGFGDERWVTASNPLNYTIRFENDPVFATAPAQVVRVTQQLDSDLDFRSFRLGDFGFGETFVDVPNNQAFYQTRLDLTSTQGIYVDVVAGVDTAQGEAFWEFTTIDPTTGEIPSDPLQGFLLPNLTPPEGDGFVNYSVRPKSTVSTGAVIDAEARIVFDINEPIDTPPIFNTIDAGTPTSSVNTLPTIAQSNEFLVNWFGSDDTNGSALANFTIYVSENGSPFETWLENTTLTEATYTGQSGRTYAFYSVARDNAGNIEAAPNTPDAQTTVSGTVVTPGTLVFGANAFSINEDGTPITAVTINRTNGTSGAVSTTVTLTDGTAINPADYNNTPIVVNFADGEISKTVTIPINNDTTVESNETINLALGNPTNGATIGTQNTATLTVVDDDVQLTFSNAEFSVNEDGTATTGVTVTRAGRSTGSVGATLTLSDGTATAADYNNTSIPVIFADGELSKAVIIPVFDDSLVEGSETVSLLLSNATGGATIGTQNTATLTITDNDTTSGVTVTGGTGNDTLQTGNGRDTISGGAGDDTIIGGVGSDSLSGGDGFDQFVYNSIRDRGDTINDFEVGKDKIVLTQLLDSLVGSYNDSNALVEGGDGYVQVVQGNNTNNFRVQIDSDGRNGADIFRPFITVNVASGGTLNDSRNFVF